jgi:hypothetical protein
VTGVEVVDPVGAALALGEAVAVGVGGDGLDPPVHAASAAATVSAEMARTVRERKPASLPLPSRTDAGERLPRSSLG